MASPSDNHATPKNSLKGYEGPDKVISVHEFRKIHENRAENPSYGTGFPSLDRHMDKLMEGELIVLSGPTKHGKSTLALTLTRNLHKIGVPSLFFTFEMSPYVLFCKRYPSLTTFVPASLKTHDLPWIYNRVQEAREKHNCRVVFIDHLYFVVDMAKMRNPSLEIGSVVRFLKTMAVELNVVVFLLTHIGKEDRQAPRAPTDADLRDSSFVAQEADSTIMVHRWFKHERTGQLYRSNDKSVINVCNHRRTGMFDQRLIAGIKDGFLEEIVENGQAEELPPKPAISAGPRSLDQILFEEAL